MPHPDRIADEASFHTVTGRVGRTGHSFMVGMAVPFPRGEAPVSWRQELTDDLGEQCLGAVQFAIGQGHPDDLGRLPSAQDGERSASLGWALVAKEFSYLRGTAGMGSFSVCGGNDRDGNIGNDQRSNEAADAEGLVVGVW
jgi:hypothetical protein